MKQTGEAPGGNLALVGLADLVQGIMHDWHVPGLVLAVVKGDEVIFSQGFGTRDRAGGFAVTPHTLFPIASCTKAFTTTALAILVDEQRLDWDTPVKHYVPTFKLYDSLASERITPRDLVTHRSGLPRHDLVWYNSPCNRQELVERLQYLEPNQDFRAVGQYQNLMYMAAGYLVEQIAGQSWEAFVQQRIFDRLGMNRSIFSTTTAQTLADFAFPYREEQGEVKPIPFYESQQATAPAGAIVSSIEEMARWLLVQVNQGSYGETRIVSEQQVAQMHTPYMVGPVPFPFAEIPLLTFGLGWWIEPYRGHLLVEHSGHIDGFSALVTLLPEQNVGVIVLCNLDGVAVPNIVAYTICDRLLELKPVAWSERFKQFQTDSKAAEGPAKEQTGAGPVPDTHPSHALDAYAGEYAHPGYGILSVAYVGDWLQAMYNGMTFPLSHYHYDIFELALPQFGQHLKVAFTTNVEGVIESVSAPLEPTVKPIVFKRLPPQAMSGKGVLQ
jgi:CubicO group peptidase (beta-lactamase class C family)